MASSLPLRSFGLALSLLAAGCSVASGNGDPSYVGTVAGTDAVIGAVSDGSHLTLYLCGGANTYTSLTHWFQGPLSAQSSFSLQAAGLTVQGDLESGEGGLTTSTGETYSFTLSPTANAMNGLYEAMDGSCRTGAVVGDFDGDGSADLQGVWCNGEGRFAQVTPLSPIVLTDRGIGIRVLIDPPKELYVDRVRAP